ncbi:MAG: hypothetical protein DMF62_02355 [Acidobacteria bacterium]|nr:MAG: hypothetical protein DMF62_02355 [Acidobacteriota bacterium]
MLEVTTRPFRISKKSIPLLKAILSKCQGGKPWLAAIYCVANTVGEGDTPWNVFPLLAELRRVGTISFKQGDGAFLITSLMGEDAAGQWFKEADARAARK